MLDSCTKQVIKLSSDIICIVRTIFEICWHSFKVPLFLIFQV